MRHEPCVGVCNFFPADNPATIETRGNEGNLFESEWDYSSGSRHRFAIFPLTIGQAQPNPPGLLPKKERLRRRPPGVILRLIASSRSFIANGYFG